MAHVQSINPRAELRRLIPTTELTFLSLDHRFMLRERKLDLRAFLWTLVFAFGAGGQASRTALHDTYLSVASHAMNESSFDAWLRKPELAAWLKGVVDYVIEQLEAGTSEEEARLAGELAQFRELFCADSSVIRLHDSLAKAFPGTRTNHSPASLKVHLVSKTHGSGLERIRITEGRRADTKTLKLGPWIRDALLLIDLGYYDFGRFARVAELGGAFVSRVKETANPLILECLFNHRGRAIKVVGEHLKDVLPRFQRQVIDLRVKVRFQARIYAGRRHYHDQELRLVGVWNADSAKYHLFFTNLEPEQLSAEAVAESYRLRWQIELLFRQLKTVHGLGKMRTTTPEAAVAFVYAAILSLLVTRRLIDAIRDTWASVESDIPFERGAKLVQRVAMNLLRLVLKPPRHTIQLHRDVLRVLRIKALDPNRRSRTTLLRKRRELTLPSKTKTMTRSGAGTRAACTIH